jgi:hypothetical protein
MYILVLTPTVSERASERLTACMMLDSSTTRQVVLNVKWCEVFPRPIYIADSIRVFHLPPCSMSCSCCLTKNVENWDLKE